MKKARGGSGASTGSLTVNFDEERLALAWREIELIDCIAWSEPLGLGVEPERRHPSLTIKPKITEHDF